MPTVFLSVLGDLDSLELSSMEDYDDPDYEKWTAVVQVSPEKNLSATAQANILQNILRQAGVTVVRQ